MIKSKTQPGMYLQFNDLLSNVHIQNTSLCRKHVDIWRRVLKWHKVTTISTLHQLWIYDEKRKDGVVRKLVPIRPMYSVDFCMKRSTSNASLKDRITFYEDVYYFMAAVNNYHWMVDHNYINQYNFA